MTNAKTTVSVTTQRPTSNGKVLLRVRPRGFCAGVVRAVDIVELALEAYGAPVYVHHEIVHNTYVVEQLRRRGAIFVETIEEVPHGDRKSTRLNSSHVAISYAVFCLKK